MKIHGGTLSVKWQKPIWKVDTLPDSSVRALLPPPPSSPCGSPPPRPESTFTSGVWSDPHHKDLRAGGAEVLSTVCRWGSCAWQLALPESHSWKQHHIFYPKAYTLVPPVQPPGPWWTLDHSGGGDGVCNYRTWCVIVDRSVEEGVLTSSLSGPCSFWALDQLFPPSVPPHIFLCCRHWHSQHAERWQQMLIIYSLEAHQLSLLHLPGGSRSRGAN